MEQPEEKKLIEAIEKLTESNENILKSNRLIHSFWRGLIHSMGSTIGLAIVLSLVAYILNFLGVFDSLRPIIKEIKDVTN